MNLSSHSARPKRARDVGFLQHAPLRILCSLVLVGSCVHGSGKTECPRNGNCNNFEHKLSLSSNLICAVDGSGVIHFWTLRHSSFRTLDPPYFANTMSEPGSGPLEVPQELVGVRFSHVACGIAHVCGLRAADTPDGRRVSCWGHDVLRQVSGSEAVDGGLTTICSGAYYSCGLMGEDAGDAAGQVVCWGEISEIIPGNPHPFKSLACGEYTVCMVDAAGMVHCRGDDLPAPPPPGVAFTHVSVGSMHACGLARTSTNATDDAEGAPRSQSSMDGIAGPVRCWGSNFCDPDHMDDLLILTRKLEHTAGIMSSVSAGFEHSCAVSAGARNLVCWGFSSPGGWPGGEWQHVVAGRLMSCAVSARGSLLACWGARRDVLEKVNERSVLMAAAEGRDLPRVDYFGPMLSGLGHLDGSWLKLLPAGVHLESSPAVHILWPPFRSIVSTRHGFRARIAASRIAQIPGDEEVTVRVLLDDELRKTLTARGEREAAGTGGEQCSLLDGAVWVEEGELTEGKHRVSVEVETSSGRRGVPQSVTFWARGGTAALEADEAGVARRAGDGREVVGGGCAKTGERGGPTVEVVKAERKEWEDHWFIVVWVVLTDFQIGRDGQMLLNNNDADPVTRFVEYRKELGAEGARLWPIAAVSPATERVDGGTRRWRVDRVLSQEQAGTPLGELGWNCYEGMELAGIQTWSQHSSGDDGCVPDSVLLEMVVQQSWRKGSDDRGCSWEVFTLSLEDGDGDPFEGDSQMSQLSVTHSCQPGLSPQGRAVEEFHLGLAGMANVERKEVAGRGLNLLTRFHHAHSSPHADSTCYWYAGPLAGGDEWRRLRLGEELERSVQHGREEGEEEKLCGFAGVLLGSAVLNPSRRIVGFYHVSTVGERWPSVVGRQLKMLRSSPLYNAMHDIRVGASGWFADVVPSLLPPHVNNAKFNFTDHNSKDMYTELGGSHVAREVPTLQLMYEYCRDEGEAQDWVWYMHSKGVGHSWPKFKWTQDWTVYMEAFLYEQPHLCMNALLHGANACGVELYHHPYLHYAGNFWWTTCERVRGLEEPDSMLPMTESTWGKPENWIGSSVGGRMMSLFSAYQTNPYGTDLPRAAYMPIAAQLHHLACPTCAGGVKA